MGLISTLMSRLIAKRTPPDQRPGLAHNSFIEGIGKITHTQAETVSAVWACIDLIAGSFSASDWNVMLGQRGGDTKTAVIDSNLQYVLNTRWNPEMTAQAGKRAVLLAAVGWGTGYAEIERDLAGRIIGLWPIEPWRVDPQRDLDTGDLFYRIYNADGVATFDMNPEDLFIVRGAGILGVVGDDPIKRATAVIASALAMEAFSNGYFSNNAQVGTVFTYKEAKKLDDAHYKRLTETLNEKHRGPRKAFKSLVLDGGDWDVKNVGSDAEGAQLIESKNLTVVDVCRFFHVPPHKVAQLDKSTNNNIEHQGLEFSRDTLRPWKVEIEQESDFKLIPYRGPDSFIEIDLDWAEQGDYKSRADAFKTLVAIGAFSPNMVLRKLGENTIGPDGDVHFVNGAAVKLSEIGVAYQQKAAAPGAATPAEPDDDEPDAAQAWLTDVYQRIDRRVQNRAEQLAKLGRAGATAEARVQTRQYAREQVKAMSNVLGARVADATFWAMEVINGCEPTIAAKAAFTEK